MSYDLFLNDTARRYADVVLPGTAWLEEVGCKMTHTHLYLMERALAPPGETRSLHRLMTTLAERLGLDGFHPWASEEAMIDAILDHPCTGHATVAALRAEGGMRALARVARRASGAGLRHPVAPDRALLGAGARASACRRCLSYDGPATAAAPAARRYPLALAQGRTMTHFHAFYDSGQALPTLAQRESEPTLWMAPGDAAARQARRPRGDPHPQRAAASCGRARTSPSAFPPARCGCATAGPASTR